MVRSENNAARTFLTVAINAFLIIAVGAGVVAALAPAMA
jgi:hypothetical protein